MAAALDADCLFCKIIRGEIPSTKVVETDHCLSFMDIFPLDKGHVLVIPKHHAAKLHELPSEYHAELGTVVGRVAKAVVAATGIDEYNVLQNNGAGAGQAVHHVHYHIIPKSSKKTGLRAVWRPEQGADKEVLAQLAEQISAHL